MRAGYVSVIVPVYNNVRCLKKCIESIRNQTYQKIQIILVDDGSKDESGRICDEYAVKDSRIEVYHNTNCGVSATRNYGLSKAYGEYIQFVDGDDYILPQMTEKMVLKMAETNSDMIVCNYVKDFQKVKASNRRLEAVGKYTNVEYLCHTLRDPGHHYFGVVWNKLYRSRVIKDNGLQFDNRVNLGEDFIFNLHYWLKCRNVIVIKDSFYIYNKENQATLSNVKHKELSDCEKELSNRKIIFAEYEDAFRKAGLYSKMYQKIQFYWIIFYARQIYGLNHEYLTWSEEERHNWRRQLENCKEIKNSLQTVTKKNQILYSCWYHMDYHVKKIVKQIGGIN